MLISPIVYVFYIFYAFVLANYTATASAIQSSACYLTRFSVVVVVFFLCVCVAQIYTVHIIFVISQSAVSSKRNIFFALPMRSIPVLMIDL